MNKLALVALLTATMAAPAAAAELTYRKDIRPLWQAKCAMCHGADAPYLGDFDENKQKYMGINKGPRMDTYADLLLCVDPEEGR